MNVRKIALGSVAGVALFVAGFTVAQAPPEQNIDPQRHGNLAAAQNLIAQAYNRLVAAQQANNYDAGGHAAKAEELLVRASHEIKEAADSLNRR